MSFAPFGFHPDLLRGVEALGFSNPTKIQEQAIPAAMAGRDVLACAQTGSGKTAAFVLPLVHRLMQVRARGPRALVLTPTRELAAQVAEHLQQLARFTAVRGAAVFGGVGMGPQEQAFRQGVDVIVATPGRLLDHMQNDYARFDALETLILDEADRMLDMGFLPDIKRIMKQLPKVRQTMLFSATMPGPIVELSKDLLKAPEAVNIERRSQPASGIEQALYPVSEDLKPALLVELLKRGEVKDVIVFCRTKHRSNRLADLLEKAGISVARIHGNRSQAQRTLALDGFKNGKIQVLVATDIVARGIDVEELSHVVNFDVPHMPEDYIHRVGRTARADATGDAYTFVAPEEEVDLRAIEKAVGRKLPRRTLEGFDYRARAEAKFEVPIAERIAAIRARKAEERTRAKEKLARKAANGGGGGDASQGRSRPAAEAPRRDGARPAPSGARRTESQFAGVPIAGAPLRGRGGRGGRSGGGTGGGRSGGGSQGGRGR